MHAIFSQLLLAVIAAALPQLAGADKEKRPEGPRPEMKQERPRGEAGQRRPDPEVMAQRLERMFNRLDADHNGALNADEIAGIPGRMKDVLEQAIKNHDGKLSQAQFAEVLKRNRPGPRPEGRPGEPQGQRRGDGRLGEGKAIAERRAGRDEGRGSWESWFDEGRGPRDRGPRDMGAGPQQRPWPPEAGRHGDRQGQAFTPGPFPKGRGESAWRRDGGPRSYEGRWNMEGPWQRHNMAQWGWQQHGRPQYGRGPMGPQGPSERLANVDPKAVFARLDRDNDGKLSVEEFSAGVRCFQRMMAGGTQQRQAPYYSHARHYGQHGRAMHQQWSQQWQHKGRSHGHRGQLAHWQGKKSDAKPSMKMKKPEARPELKKSEGERPRASGAETKAIEARLVSLKIDMEKRAAGLARLKKAEESLKADLTKLERQRDEVAAKLRKAAERQKTKELAALEKGAKAEKKREKKSPDQEKSAKDM